MLVFLPPPLNNNFSKNWSSKLQIAFWWLPLEWFLDVLGSFSAYFWPPDIVKIIGMVKIWNKCTKACCPIGPLFSKRYSVPFWCLTLIGSVIRLGMQMIFMAQNWSESISNNFNHIFYLIKNLIFGQNMDIIILLWHTIILLWQTMFRIKIFQRRLINR